MTSPEDFAATDHTQGGAKEFLSDDSGQYSGKPNGPPADLSFDNSIPGLPDRPVPAIPSGPVLDGCSETLDLYIRSFAPWDSFGGGFHGDGRTFSTSPSVSSRISAHIRFKVPEMTIVSSEIHSDPSSHPLRGPRTATPTLYVDGSGPHYLISYEGANPLVPHSPNIDVLVDVTAQYQAPLGVCFEGNVLGDGFPNAEMFVRQPAGDQMLFTYGVEDTWLKAVTGPMTGLPGTGRSPMGSFNECVPVP
jgi:hypothetical protein